MGAAQHTFSGESRVRKHKDVAWLDVENPTPEVFTQLERDYHLHPVHLNESIEKIELTRVERETDYIFFLLHVPILDPSHDKILVNQIGIFLGKDYLITISNGQNPVIHELFEIFEESAEHQGEYSKNGSAYLLYGVVKNLLDRLEVLTQPILNELDTIEDLVFDDNISDAYRIGKVRQKIVKLRRIIGSLKLILQDLNEQIDSFTGAHLSKHYANNTKTANKLWEVIEEAKETVEIYKDADFTTSTEQTNRILAVLTLLFTFTIPITVLGTIYGMNVTLPGVW